ncbi:hypothetical protein [Polaromonas sp. YR568]|uniref:hypothetical protein n=1 Tax=Polaromonas sp. YR568 TaxID=1855301 RepID=UPI003137B1CF
MSRTPTPAEVDALSARLPRWFPAAVGWSLDLANRGPVVIPHPVRLLPLRGCAAVLRLYAGGWL